MPNGPQCQVSLHLMCPMGKVIKVLNFMQMKMFGDIKAITNQGATYFPTLTIQIGEVIHIICGMNLNNFNKVDIGSKTSSIQDLCSHHSIPHNNSNQIKGVENQNQEMQDRVKRVDELEMQVGQIVEFMAQIRDQSELSNSNIANSKAESELDEAITLEGDMKDEAVPEPSKHSPNMDELLLQAEEEEDDLGSLEEFLLQAPQIPMSSNSGEGVLNSLHSNDIPPNVLFPSRFFIPKQEESEKDIVEALPKVQKDIPILGATKQVLDRVEYFKGLCFPRRTIQENEVVEADQEFIQGAVHETIKPKAVEFDDPGQATTIIVDLAKFKVPEMFKDVVFVIEFVSEKESKPSSPILILIYTNMFLILMIQAPTLEFKPLPNHFKYHLPLKDKFHALEPRGVLRKVSSG
ncbi:uncharacterized protein LOC126619269 [Malus sylvestris]|uniref:uncharacterized protein LOC126619269 n=1 Tax=Malus sylvestris TaxID=3752 RepID=UPI0021AC4844|nr:uncharacterized protein LOC126619269 [Malus sylvestris]